MPFPIESFGHSGTIDVLNLAKHRQLQLEPGSQERAKGVVGDNASLRRASICQNVKVLLTAMFTDFRQAYGNLSDEELLQIASDRSSLVEEANAALDREMRNRGLTHDDQAKHQHLVKRYERRERRRRVRKLLRNRRDGDSWVETAVMLFWSALAIALISIAYIALPSRYHFSPDWQEAAEYVMIGSVIFVAASFGPWLRRGAFWISLLISSFAHAVIVHTWIVRKGSLDGHRGEQELAVLVGPVLFLVVYGCGFFLRRKFYGEEEGSDTG